MKIPQLSSLPQLTNHAPVSVTLVASAVTSILIALAKSKYGIDLSGQEANVTIVVGALAGYLTGRGKS
jgi:hypothetical protein